MSVDVATATTALRAQWDRLHDWVEVMADPRLGRESSVLAGWTIVDLWAHLGRAMDALAVCTPAPAGTVPLTLGEYLGSYAGRAADVAETTRQLAAEHALDPVGYVTSSARQAFATLERLGPGDPVVQARRGPVRLSTMTVSRLLELVVHGDDLVRSVRRARGSDAVPDPVDPGALALVADELLAIVRARGGWDLEVADARRWVRLATGRVPYDVDALAVALQARYTSDAVPDLGRMLPLL
ncbi:maleylpyruvate isomerase N-terminal domain-containing protein [Cellulomonas wangsupingiae]|uniref:Maleylpyruvate isomerase N-terminal domain-containing protein n=1 Tax=Cellulomonas wangsupingiae TaxID=2968085 RepID=A0ABY5K6Q6_9CELL|nr:maleylpyruvate isomerase N-terminal domain-containing protein [Cellulomonas wangsupingiae]MCC2336275.1 maleylpyruvate isomerase N-terminal domain-containing protein [Cellulomonas wangsupingiae]UUI65743.1 maleylpyruvate isomerase N-terminal domain-containing protein [Cellulomonas wangsupingiae]